VRLRAEGTVCAELSGGLDSSSIVCMADDILRAGEAEAERVQTISHVFDRAARSDERPFIRAVEKWRGRPGIHLREDDHPILAPLPEDARLEYPTYEHAFAARHEHVEQTLRLLGARVLLSGVGGDQVTWGSVGLPLEPADLLCELRLFRFLSSLRAWSRALAIPYVELLWEGTVHPLLPRRVRSSIPAWINPAFRRRMSFPDRRLGARAQGLPSDRFQALMLQSCVEICSRGYFLLDGCIEVSYPFLHRPLVEFLLAIPLSQKIRPGESRSLMRRALRELLPAEVVSRTSKAGPTSAIFGGIAREWRWIEALLESPRVAERGWVDARLLRLDFERARHGAPVDNSPLIKVLSLELWLRSIERWSSSALEAPVPVLAGPSWDAESLERR
jgi:asparagine synthase (glutamine-hydrolysing)